MKKKLVKIVAAALSLCMLILCIPSAAFAKGLEVIADGDGVSKQGESLSDISESSETDSVNGASVVGRQGGSATGRVEGNITAETTADGRQSRGAISKTFGAGSESQLTVTEDVKAVGDQADGVDTFAGANSASTLQVDGNVTAQGKTKALGASASTGIGANDASATTTVGKDVTATAVSGYSTGVYTAGEGALTVVGGNVTSTSKEGSSVGVETEYGSKAEIGGNVSAGGAEAVGAVLEGGPSSSSIEIKGDVTAQGETRAIAAEVVSGYGNGVLSVEGELNAVSGGDSYGLSVSGAPDITLSSSNLTIQTGSISAKAEGGQAQGIHLNNEGSGTGGKTDIDVNGDLSAEGSHAKGVEIGNGTGEANIQIHGNLSANGTGEEGDNTFGIYLAGGNGNIIVDGSVEAFAEKGFVQGFWDNSGNGFAIDSDPECRYTIVIKGNLAASSDEGYAIAGALRGNSTLAVEGDLIAYSKENGAQGLRIDNAGSGTAAFAETGTIHASTDSDTAKIYGLNSLAHRTDADITVKGDIVASGGNGGAAVSVTARSDVSIDVAGAVSLENNQTGQGMRLSAHDGGALEISVGQGLDSSGEGVSLGAAADGTIDLLIHGDLNAADAGLEVTQIVDEGKIDVVVAESILSESTAIILGKNVNLDNLQLTTWQVSLHEDTEGEKRAVFADKAKATSEKSKTFEKAINYIIKSEQPVKGGTFTVGGTRESHGYDTAREGEKVVLKANADKGYRVVGAFNGQDNKVALQKDGDGNYFLIVPRGGGVYLSAVLEKVAPQPDPDPAPDPGPQPRKAGNALHKGSTATILLDPNGGSINGKTEIVKKHRAVGQTIRFFNAPDWEGHTFLYWENVDDPEFRIQPKEWYKVTGNAEFRAVWED